MRGAARDAISPSPSRSTTSGSSPRPSSIRTSGRTPRVRRAGATASRSMSPSRSTAGWSSTAATRAITPASRVPSTTAPGTWATYITDAPVATGSAGALSDESGPLERRLNTAISATIPLSSGPCVELRGGAGFPGRRHLLRQCAHRSRAGQRQGIRRAESRRALRRCLGWSASLGIYNLLNTHAAAARVLVRGSPASARSTTYPDGRADIHEHPLEPIMARFTISWLIGTR